MNTLTTKRLKNLINEKIGTVITEDLVFQVSAVQAKDTNKTTIFIGAMSDGEHETTPIFIFNRRLETNNIVVLKTIEIVERSSKALILVKKHEILDDNTNERIGNPVTIHRTGEISLLDKAKELSKKNQKEKEDKAYYYKQGAKPNNNNNSSNNNNNNLNQGKNTNANQGNYNNNNNNKEVKKNNFNNNKNNNNNNNINEIEDNQEVDYENTALSQYYKFHDIDSFTENFVILVRVIALDEKNYVAKKSKEPGVLGKYTLIDYSGEEMDITVFNKTLEMVKSKLSINKVYEISRVDAKPNENRRRKDSPNFSINFNTMSNIQEVTDDNILRLMPIMSKSSFLDIKKLPEYQRYDEVDVMVLILKMNPIEAKSFKKTLNVINNTTSIKKIVAVGASSEPTEVEITFFGEVADQFESLNLQVNSIIALKRVTVNEYNGVKNLTSGKATIVTTKENDLRRLSNQEYRKLEALRDGSRENIKKLETGNKTEYSTVNSSIARMTKIASVTMTNDVVNRQPIEAFRIPGYASLKIDFGDSAYYPACPNCKKKVVDINDGNGNYECTPCKKVSEPNWTWKINFMIKDKTDKTYVSSFGIVGDQLTGMSAKEFATRYKTEGPALSMQLRNEINFRKKYVFIVKPKIEEYQGSSKLKYNVLRAILINEKTMNEECGNILNNFESLYIK